MVIFHSYVSLFHMVIFPSNPVLFRIFASGWKPPQALAGARRRRDGDRHWGAECGAGGVADDTGCAHLIHQKWWISCWKMKDLIVSMMIELEKSRSD